MSNSDEPKPAIQVKGITKTFKIPLDKGKSVKNKILGKAGKGYREFTPLNDVSFTIYEGDFFGIVGRNGSGKSTLLKTIAGIYEPTAGKVEVNGTLVPFIELGVGFNPNLTGRENVYLNAALLGFSRSEIDDMYDDIVDFAELHDFMEERLQNYSSGMQVRLAFSISIRAKGDILLLDEVLAVGDSAFQQKCYDYFEQLKDEKKTVILVTHSMSNVERFCNRALLLDSGKISLIGSNQEVAEKYRELFRRDKKDEVETPKPVNSNAPVEIVAVETLQGSSPTLSIAAFKDFSIKVSLRLKEDVYDPNLVVAIKDSRGNMVLSTDTQNLTGSYLTLYKDKPTTVTFDIENIYTNGEYSIDVFVGVADGTGRKRVVDSQAVQRFSITGVKNHSYSMTHPRIKATIEN